MRHDFRVLPSSRFGHVVGGAADDGLVEQCSGVGRCVDEIDVAHRFLGQPGTEQFVVSVADAQPEQHPVRATVVEAFVAGEEQLADQVERIMLAAAVTQRLVLDSAADLIDAALATRTTWNGSATRRA